jgi:hypothetical protein
VTVDNATTINGDTTLNGATVNLAPSGNINVTAGGNFQILSGAGFRIYNSGNTDYVDHAHDGTDFTTCWQQHYIPEQPPSKLAQLVSARRWD